jgi:lipoyl(octanoyl) transferase
MFWRLILSGRGEGARNMAIDEALLTAFGQAKANGEKPVPVVRFYGWQPACLSIGYAQKAEREIDFVGCEKLGVGWVRRPTGGRAILHEWGELTYSLVAAEDDPYLVGNLLTSYRKISEALLAGLTRLQVRAEAASEENVKAANFKRAYSAACFDAPSAYEVTFEGRKLIGSAQARRNGIFLQQGTILLKVAVERLFSAIKPPPKQTRSEAIAQVQSRLTDIETALGRPVGFEEAQAAFVAGFAAHFGIEFYPSDLTPLEQTLTDQLLAEKYANPTWNLTRQKPQIKGTKN